MLVRANLVQGVNKVYKLRVQGIVRVRTKRVVRLNFMVNIIKGEM